jgi:hypothetical protein
MTDCPFPTKDAAVRLLANHRTAKADTTKDAFKTIEPTKKVDCVLFKAKNTSLATMARMEGKLDGKLSLAFFTLAPPLQISRARLWLCYKKKGT